MSARTHLKVPVVAAAALLILAFMVPAPVTADEVPPNYYGTWYSDEGLGYGEGYFLTYGYASYPDFADEQMYFLYTGVFGTGGGYCSSYCPGDTPAVTGYNNPWQMYWDSLSPWANDFAGQACYKFYWSGQEYTCGYNSWKVNSSVFGNLAFNGNYTWYSNASCSYYDYDETMVWADYVLGTPIAKVETATGGYGNTGMMYMWPVILSGSLYPNVATLYHMFYYCYGGGGYSSCPCPLYGSYYNNCYKDLFCFNSTNYYLRSFYMITAGPDAGSNWDNHAEVYTNDYNMDMMPPTSTTKCYVMVGILGSPPCLCCSEYMWGYSGV